MPRSAEATRQRIIEAAYRLFRRQGFNLNPLGMVQKTPPGWSERRAGRRAIDQPGVECCFQSGQPARHGRVIDAQMLSGGCQTALPCHSQKDADVVPVFHAPPQLKADCSVHAHAGGLCCIAPCLHDTFVRARHAPVR